MDALDRYLVADAIVEADAPEVRALARQLHTGTAEHTGAATHAGVSASVTFARAAFEWVRDEVSHSVDVGDPTVTLTATEVLARRVGLCFAKSHLLAALLRAQGIPTGFCYQRLVDGDHHVLHGLIAIHLNGGWHRQDPRGNNAQIDARFSLGAEHLAFAIDPERGEIDYQTVFDAPATVVVEALCGATDALELCAHGLPSELR